MTSIIKVDTLQKANGGTPTAADLGINVGGNILQVKEIRSGNQTTRSSAGWEKNTGFANTITPTSASSKFLIVYNIWGIIYGSTKHLCWDLNRTVNGVDTRLSGTSYGLGTIYTGSAGELQTQCSISILDSPATTNDVTYTPMFNNINNGSSASLGNAARSGHCVVMEIAG